MGIFSGLFRSRDKPQNSTAGSGYHFYMGGTSAGKMVSDIDAIERYGDALEQLKARGVSDTLLDEILGMSVDDAAEYTGRLLAMTDGEYNDYIALWERKQRAAADIAERFYADEMTALVNEYVEKVPESLSIMKEDLYEVGQLAAKGLAKGLLSAASVVENAAKTVAAAAREALQESEGIHSPAKKWAVLGDYMAQGIGVGFTQRMDSVSREIAASITALLTLLQTGAFLYVEYPSPLGDGTGYFEIDYPTLSVFCFRAGVPMWHGMTLTMTGQEVI